MQRAEPTDERGERIDGERRERDEVERAGVERPDRADRVEHGARSRIMRRAGPSKARPASVDDDRATDPVEQPHAELGLEPADSLRERRLRDADCHRRPQ